jgi:hypothetical protein
MVEEMQKLRAGAPVQPGGMMNGGSNPNGGNSLGFDPRAFDQKLDYVGRWIQQMQMRIESIEQRIQHQMTQVQGAMLPSVVNNSTTMPGSMTPPNPSEMGSNVGLGASGFPTSAPMPMANGINSPRQQAEQAFAMQQSRPDSFRQNAAKYAVVRNASDQSYAMQPANQVPQQRFQDVSAMAMQPVTPPGPKRPGSADYRRGGMQNR